MSARARYRPGELIRHCPICEGRSFLISDDAGRRRVSECWLCVAVGTGGVPCGATAGYFLVQAPGTTIGDLRNFVTTHFRDAYWHAKRIADELPPGLVLTRMNGIRVHFRPHHESGAYAEQVLFVLPHDLGTSLPVIREQKGKQ